MVFQIGSTNDNYFRINGSGNAHLIISNDSSTNDLSFSFDSQSSQGILLPNETIEFKDLNEDTVYVKSRISGNDCNFRVWFYGNQKIVYPKAQTQIAQENKQVPIPNKFSRIPNASI